MAGETRAAIAITNLEKIYATQDGSSIRALGPVSIDIRPHEFVSVVGPSGCGKSTLLKILAGILRRTSGDVHLGGSPIDGYIVAVRESHKTMWMEVGQVDADTTRHIVKELQVRIPRTYQTNTAIKKTFQTIGGSQVLRSSVCTKRSGPQRSARNRRAHQSRPPTR